MTWVRGPPSTFALPICEEAHTPQGMLNKRPPGVTKLATLLEGFARSIDLIYQYSMPLPLQVAFVAGSSGMWRIERITAVAGENLPPAERLAVIEGPEVQRPLEGSWILRGTTSNSRYTNREELKALSVKEEMLLRPQATHAALIPIRKTAAWWGLAQDERRAIFEEQSRHIGIGMEYLPAIARRLHHSRELGE